MRRREFITLLGGAALALPARGGAQEQRARRIAALIASTQDNAEVERQVAAFHDGLQKLGWVEGRNLHIDHRWGGTDMNMLQRLAKEIVATKPDLIFTSGSPTTRILKQETGTIPIVFGNLVDPVGQGFVASLARPGGNVTGFVNLEPSVAGKYVELLKEIAPQVARVVIFYNPATELYHEIYLNPFNAAATSLGLVPIVAPIRDLADLETVMATQAREPNTGLIAMPGGFQSQHYQEIAALAATIPIVFVIGADPVKAGLVSSFNRPAANITGVTVITDLVITKRLELLRELLPAADVMALLLNSHNPNAESRSRDVQRAARALGRRIYVLYASDEREINAAFAKLVQQRIGALLVQSDPFFTTQRDQLVALAARNDELWSQPNRRIRQGGVYTGRILKGEKPVDLPVMQPTKFELVINLKTAKALGLEVPPTLLATVDEVIE
jgi:ABC-type uncharacterized transport system substrate-binding protein